MIPKQNHCVPSALRKVYALGFFDGVHLGHQALLESACSLARELDAQCAAITFDRHPHALLRPQCPPLINDCGDRIHLLRFFGAEHVRLLPVTEAVMGMPWEGFLEELLADGAVGFVCGYDFRFGRGGEGNAEKLRAYCRRRQLSCRVLPEQSIQGVRISSTHIRSLLEAGKMEEAVRFLGHPHLLSGQVVHGRNLGHKLGFPTANVPLPENAVCPRHGVYAARAWVDGRGYGAVTNVGSRPTVQGTQVRTETWILGLEQDLYGKRISLELHAFLRPEEAFSSLEQLQAAVRLDAEKATAFFEKMA